MNQSTSPRTEKPTIYPTLVIGVGGMGTNTVRAAKRRFRMAWGGDKLPGMIQLMALDTEPLVNRLDQEPLFADEFAYMGKFDATRLVDNIDNHPEIGRWWNYPSIPLGYIHNGAKQLRPIGRLSFFRNYVTFKRQLENKYAALDKIRDMEMAQNRGFPVMGNYQLVYIVSSLCGGTGGGMILDVAHAVRATGGKSCSGLSRAMCHSASSSARCLAAVCPARPRCCIEQPPQVPKCGQGGETR